MNKVVCKFGGTSLADADQIKKVCDIINANPDRKYIVVSASGKRSKDDDKITDLLINLHLNINDNKVRSDILDILNTRYIEIIKKLNITFDIKKELSSFIEKAKNEKDADFLASRGEYLSAMILSIYLDAIFLDAANVIIFDENKKIDFNKTYSNLKSNIEKIEKEFPDKKIVIPGFYGSTENNQIITFSRGGSDITGSLVARSINANLYENWTDVSGVLFEDPRIIDNPKVIDYITYTELRELSYMGASVLHEAAIFPVSQIGIPINILNTNKPSDKGTMIVSNIPSIVKRKTVTGIAGKKGFSSILLQKALMNEQVGFLSKLLKIFEDEKISVEHCPTGIDTVSVIIKSELLEKVKDYIIDKIKKELNPDVIALENNLALIAIVGEGMTYSKKINSTIFSLLADANVTVKMIDQGSSDINIIIGVANSDYEKAMQVLSPLQDIND